jgi:hypothetical protein
MSDDETDVCSSPLPELNSLDECNVEPTSPQEMANLDGVDTADRSAMRDPKTGQFIKGWKGGGRPKGAKDKLNQQVIGTLERIWQIRGDEIIEHLAAEKPEVLAGLVAKLIPQSLAAEAIEGESQKNQGHSDVTIRVVTQQQQHDALPAREVEGELMLDEPTTH